MAKKWKSGETLRQTATHPIGRLTLAGLLVDYQVTQSMPMRFWDTFVVVYVLAGRARFHDETGLSLPVRPGDLILMFPGHGYHYDIDPRRPWSEFALHFQGPVFDLWQQLKILDPARPIYHLKPIEPWMERFERLVRPRPSAAPAISSNRSANGRNFWRTSWPKAVGKRAIVPETCGSARPPRCWTGSRSPKRLIGQPLPGKWDCPTAAFARSSCRRRARRRPNTSWPDGWKRPARCWKTASWG